MSYYPLDVYDAVSDAAAHGQTITGNKTTIFGVTKFAF